MSRIVDRIVNVDAPAAKLARTGFIDVEFLQSSDSLLLASDLLHSAVLLHERPDPSDLI
jgi:hypothetical protein